MRLKVATAVSVSIHENLKGKITLAWEEFQKALEKAGIHRRPGCDRFSPSASRPAEPPIIRHMICRRRGRVR